MLKNKADFISYQELAQKDYAAQQKKIIVCEYCGRIMVDPQLAGVEA